MVFSDRQSTWRTAIVYALMLGAAVVVFAVVQSIGTTLSAPPGTSHGPEGAVGAGQATADAFLHVLVSLTAVVITGRILARVFRSIGQPPVIGDVVAGILLGPSLLGRISPELAASLLPPSSAPFLGVIAQLAVALYMFLVGLELNPGQLRGRAHSVVLTSHTSIVLPFVAGSVLALYLYPRLSTSDVPFTSFALFLGIAMSITAFPVLARILADRGITRTQLGTVALTCAAINDVTAWCLLALVIGIARAQLQSGILVVIWTLGFIGVMFLAVRPLVSKLAGPASDSPPGRETLAFAFTGLLLASLTTEWIGIHAIFGAFLFGAVIPHDSAVARALTGKLDDFVSMLLLPSFFALTGMRTQISLLSSASDWLICGLIILVATLGKFGGTLFSGRLTGMTWRDAGSLGILMNTRGLMELIVLNIGLELGVISPTLFTMMVLMALATTIATSPALQLMGASSLHQAERATVHAPAL